MLDNLSLGFAPEGLAAGEFFHQREEETAARVAILVDSGSDVFGTGHERSLVGGISHRFSHPSLSEFAARSLQIERPSISSPLSLP